VKADLEELVSNKVIDPETARRIREYYDLKSKASKASRLLLILSITGIVLVGLGLILLIAYNWESLPKAFKLAFAFLPLAATQTFGLWVLVKKGGLVLWHESAALAILFAVGIAMSLVTQIYHIEGALSGFLQWWIILSAPLVPVFISDVVSLAVWIGTGWYLTSISWTRSDYDLFAPAVILLALGWYSWRLRHEGLKKWMTFHHWVIPIVLTIYIFSLAPHTCNRFLLIALLTLFMGFGGVAFTVFKGQGLLTNGFRTGQFLGTWITGIILGFEFYWTSPLQDSLSRCIADNPVFLPLVNLAVLGYLAYALFRRFKESEPDDLGWMGLALIAVVIAGSGYPGFGHIAANIILLAGSARIIYGGLSRENLWLLNLGLLTLASWVISRFFETNISFVWKGLLFITLGILCFGLNWFILKKQRT